MADKQKNSKPADSGRRINTGGGAYIEGGLHTGGGDFVGRDQTKVTIGAGADKGSLADLIQLVAEIRALTAQARLDQDIQEVIEVDFKVLETQLKKPEPKKALVLPKLEAVAKTLTLAAGAGEAITRLTPMVQQAIQWAQTVLK